MTRETLYKPCRLPGGETLPVELHEAPTHTPSAPRTKIVDRYLVVNEVTIHDHEGLLRRESVMSAIDGFVIAAKPAAHFCVGPIGKLPSVVRADSADHLVVATRATLAAVTLPRGPDLDQHGRV